MHSKILHIILVIHIHIVILQCLHKYDLKIWSKSILGKKDSEGLTMGICLPIPIPCNHTNIHFTIILHACHNHSCLILHNCVPNNKKSHNLNNSVYPPHNLQDKTKFLYILSLNPTINHLIMFSMLIFISILHIFPLK